jgi:hypothetical protein
MNRKPTAAQLARERAREAFDALLAQGVTPTGDRVVAWLQANRPPAGSMRELHPVLSELRRRRLAARAIADIVERYRRLDVLQRQAARAYIDCIDRGEPTNLSPAAGGGMQEAVDAGGTK